jgi:hypothetical protein
VVLHTRPILEQFPPFLPSFGFLGPGCATCSGVFSTPMMASDGYIAGQLRLNASPYNEPGLHI